MNREEAEDPKEMVSRREALKIIAGSAGAAVSLPILTGNPSAHAAAAHQVVRTAASAYVPTFFSPSEIRTVDALAETIIPADDHSPGARAAEVYAYIDTVVAESDERRRAEWREGLAAVDRLAQAAYGRNFADSTTAQQIAVLEKLAAHEDHPATQEEHFFVIVKRATIEGYYTSAIGIHQDLNYHGNTALADFPGCAHEEHGGGR